MTDTAPIITVTVTHIPLTKEIYHLILAALRVYKEECGEAAGIDKSTQWLHYRWLVESSEAKGVDVTQKSV